MAVVFPNMSLVGWDQLSDNFDHTQLATNMQKVDAHDHTSGKGVQVPGAGIQDGAITANKLAPGAIPAFIVADGSITDVKIGAGSIDITKFAALPHMRITNNADQTVTPSTGFVAVNFNTTVVDSHAMHPSAGISATCTNSGVYLITATVAMSPITGTSTPNSYKTRIVLNSGTPIAQTSEGFTTDNMNDILSNRLSEFGTDAGVRSNPLNGWITTNVSTVYRLSSSGTPDTIQVHVGNNSTTYGIVARSLASFSPVLTMTWLGP